MAKQSGLGDNLYVAGYNISGDVGSLGRIGGGPEVLEATGIDKSAMERLFGKRAGSIEFAPFWNPDTVTDGEHEALSALPRTDVIATYARGTALGGPAAACIGKQANYDWARGEDGSLAGSVQILSNSFGIEWGIQMTPGVRLDTPALPVASDTDVDTGASLSFGAQLYLQVFSFAGTSVTYKLQDSADNVTFADVTGGGFTAVSAAPAQQRIQTSRVQTIRRYVRIVTTGTFTSATSSIVLVKNTAAVAF